MTKEGIVRETVSRLITNLISHERIASSDIFAFFMRLILYLPRQIMLLTFPILSFIFICYYYYY